MTTEERLTKLEQELVSARAQARRANRRLLFTAAGCVGAALGWVLIAQTERGASAEAKTPATVPALKEVRANTFILENAKGEVCAMLCSGKDGPCLSLGVGEPSVLLEAHKNGASLALFDEGSKAKFAVTMDKDGPGLSMAGADGDPRLILREGKEGPSLNMYANGGEPRVALATTKDGADLRMFDGNGKARVGVMTRNEHADLYLRDTDNTVRALLSLGKNGPAMYLAGATDEMKASLRVDDELGPTLTVKRGKGSVFLDVPKGGRVAIEDVKGKTVWEAPK